MVTHLCQQAQLAVEISQWLLHLQVAQKVAANLLPRAQKSARGSRKESRCDGWRAARARSAEAYQRLSSVPQRLPVLQAPAFAVIVEPCGLGLAAQHKQARAKAGTVSTHCRQFSAQRTSGQRPPAGKTLWVADSVQTQPASRPVRRTASSNSRFSSSPSALRSTTTRCTPFFRRSQFR